MQVKVVLQKTDAFSLKKYKAIFTGPSFKKTIYFGAKHYLDFTLVKDKQQALKKRNSYRKRHVHDRINTFDTPGALSWWILWGNSQSVQQNFIDYKKRFGLK